MCVKHEQRVTVTLLVKADTPQEAEAKANNALAGVLNTWFQADLVWPSNEPRQNGSLLYWGMRAEEFDHASPTSK